VGGRPAVSLLHCSHVRSRQSPTSRKAQAPENVAWDSGAALATDVDQACFESDQFWSLVGEFIPGFADDPSLNRFRGFCTNLQTFPPGAVKICPDTGREVLEQYHYPGLPPPQRSYENADFPWVSTTLESAELIEAARRELAETLEVKPLIADGVDADPSARHTWKAAAWYGWQFLPLRAVKGNFQRTIQLLQAGSIPYAHRFCGLARQRSNSTGLPHSDRRNYMLSTLTGLEVPTNKCGITVGGETRELRTGESLVLDNTYVHSIYNHGDRDRFVLMLEIWHPDMSAKERSALATLFAVKDLYAAMYLDSMPWGLTDKELIEANGAGHLQELAFWKDLAFGVPPLERTIQPQSIKSKNSAATKKKKPKKPPSKKPSSARGFGRAKI